MRIIGVDLGDKRIGVAAADDSTRVALPLTTIVGDGDPVEAIIRLAREEGADTIVVGLPLSMSGAIGPQAARVMAQVEALGTRLPIPIYTWDERLTTVQAGRHAHSRRRGARDDRMRRNRDAVAAAIMLQSYLDSNRP